MCQQDDSSNNSNNNNNKNTYMVVLIPATSSLYRQRHIFTFWQIDLKRKQMKRSKKKINEK